MKKYRIKIILCLFFTFVGLLALEITSRFRYQGDLRLIRDTDHRLIPNGKDVNSDSLRSQREATDFDSAGLNILVLGDSFVYGWRVPAEQAFPQQFEALIEKAHPELHLKVVNAGWPSASPYLALRLLKDVGKKYHPDVVFLCVNMTDFHDDIKYKRLVESDTLIYKGLSIAPGLITFLKQRLDSERMENSGWHEAIFDMPADRFFATSQPLSQTRPWLATTQETIIAIDRYVRDELQAKFILVVLPRSFQYSDKECPDNWEKDDYEVLGPYCREPFVYFDEIRPKVDYPIYSLLETFKNTAAFPTCFQDDPHWNETGLAIAAQALMDIGIKEGYLPPNPLPSSKADPLSPAAKVPLVTSPAPEPASPTSPPDSE